jgi:hypothetical protein
MSQLAQGGHYALIKESSKRPPHRSQATDLIAGLRVDL